MIDTNGALLALRILSADAFTGHLLAVLSGCSEQRATARYTSRESLADLRQTPITGHASIAFQTAYAWLALALSGLRIAGIRHTAQLVAVARTRAASTVRSLSRRFAIRAASVPGVRTL